MDRHYDAIERAFPELATIENDELRDNVCETWAIAMTDTDIDDLETVAWFPPVQRDLDLLDERLVPHVQDVTQGALEAAIVRQADTAAAAAIRARAVTDLRTA